MAKVYDNISELTGNTPLVRLKGIAGEQKTGADLIAKIEFINPSRSIKDRPVAELLADLRHTGELKQGGNVIAAADGNTAVALAQACAVGGNPMTIVMPSQERIEIGKLAGGYGVKVLRTKGTLEDAEKKAAEVAAVSRDTVLLDLSELREERGRTGEEIWKDTGGRLDWLVADKDTLDTLGKSVEYLKGQNPGIRFAAAVRENSDNLPKENEIQITVSEKDARKAAAYLAAREGILAGISSGAALTAALHLAGQKENENARIVVILPDTGERYLSTEVFGAVLTPPDPF